MGDDEIGIDIVGVDDIEDDEEMELDLSPEEAAATEEDEEISIETSNANTLNALKMWLEATASEIVFAQELRTEQAEIEDFIYWASKRGWKVIATGCNFT